MASESTQPYVDGAATDSAATHALHSAQRSMAALRDGSEQLMKRAHLASDHTVDYIKQEPVKALFMAAAAGAALMALLSLFTRSRGHR
jgi:ElaB/YqjD/DUF883 family membrane-anchored ribosome-binding protein